MIKRAFDLVFSALGLLVLFPVFIILALFIIFDSKGGIFYRQKRVGRNQVEFWLYKFRTMKTGAEKSGLLTVGMQDSRITNIGKVLRKYKLDELPQLWNIFTGEMSFVGPRPEVPYYVNLYNEAQKKVLLVKPGLTDFASLEFINENEILEKYPDTEKAYVEKIMPLKLELNLKYIDELGFRTDLKILGKTLARILGS